MSVSQYEQLYFNLYEIMGNIIPGSMILGTYFIKVNLRYVYLLPESLSLMLFIFFAFVIGQALHFISSAIEVVINNKKYGGYPSSQYLLNEDDTFPQYFKDTIRNKLNADYGTPFDSPSQHMFDLCYTYVTQNKISNRVLIFLNMYTFSKNMMVTLCIEGILLFIWAYVEHSYYVGMFSAISIITTYFFYKRFSRYSTSFAKEVFRSYFISNI